MKTFLNLFAQQIASATVDAPFSGFLVNQNIDESMDVLQWETERATTEPGTYSISLPSGLASNKQSILFVATDTASTLTVVSRDYGDTTDKTLICVVDPDEPFYCVLQNIKSATLTTTAASVEWHSFCAKVSPTSTTGTTNPNQGIDPGSLPVGGLIPISGVFSAPGSGYSETGILPLPSYLQLCDGGLVSDSDSIFYGKFLPNLTGNITLFGSTTGGVSASSTTTATVLTGFGSDWNIYQDIDVAAAYQTKIYMRIK